MGARHSTMAHIRVRIMKLCATSRWMTKAVALWLQKGRKDKRDTLAHNCRSSKYNVCQEHYSRCLCNAQTHSVNGESGSFMANVGRSWFTCTKNTAASSFKWMWTQKNPSPISCVCIQRFFVIAICAVVYLFYCNHIHIYQMQHVAHSS